jgi:urease gamma subunit
LIHVKATVTGEKDTSPFFRVIEYSDESYNTIFVPSVNKIKDKIATGLRININECLAFYSEYVVSQLRTRNRVERIERGAKILLSSHNVMTGVPESLRKIVFQTELDGVLQNVVMIQEPIKIPRYILGSND